MFLLMALHAIPVPGSGVASPKIPSCYANVCVH